VRDAVGAKSGEVVGKARQIGVTLVQAAKEGRAAMRDTELELRREHPVPPRVTRPR
jgi:hypothetical protein